MKNSARLTKRPAGRHYERHWWRHHHPGGGRVRGPGVLLRDRRAPDDDRPHVLSGHIHADVRDQLLHPPDAHARPRLGAAYLHVLADPTGVRQVQGRGQGRGVRSFIASGAEVAERRKASATQVRTHSSSEAQRSWRKSRFGWSSCRYINQHMSANIHTSGNCKHDGGYCHHGAELFECF